MTNKRKIDFDITWEQMTGEQRERFKAFMRSTMMLSDEQLKCLEQGKMSYEMFIEILTIYTICNNKNEFVSLCQEYLDYSDRFIEELEATSKKYAV